MYYVPRRIDRARPLEGAPDGCQAADGVLDCCEHGEGVVAIYAGPVVTYDPAGPHGGWQPVGCRGDHPERWSDPTS